MFDHLQYLILKRLWPGRPDFFPDNFYEGKSKLRILLGEELLSRIQGKKVIDFGCGDGTEAIEMAQAGASGVIGLDIREDVLQLARDKAATLGLANICLFATSSSDPADIIVSIDAFEHFGDPAGILKLMRGLLKPEGEIFVSFGPTWYHPLGGHLFSVFPWAHLIFSEDALIRWRSTFKTDGATRFSEVAGGLNRMTIARFGDLVNESGLSLASLELVPIGKLRPIHGRWTREFTTAIVRCRLTKAETLLPYTLDQAPTIPTRPGEPDAPAALN